MAERFFIKKFPKPSIINCETKEIENISQEKKNKKNKKNDDMKTEINDKIKQAEETLTNMEREVKVVKREKGLIERTESSKIVLAEDNRQLLGD